MPPPKHIADFTPEQWDIAPVRCSLWFPAEKINNDRWHRHLGFYELVIFLEGTVRNDSPAGPLIYKPGDVVIHPPGSVHHYSCLRSTRYYNILFLPEAVEGLTAVPGLKDLLTAEGCSPLFHLNGHYSTQATAIADDMQREYLLKAPGWEISIKAQLARLLVLLLRSCNDTTEQPPDSPAWKITRSIHFMERKFAEKLTLSQLAAFSSMSESSYRHNFKSITGLPPKQYLLLLRLQHACWMLFSGKNITETALSSGFEEREYFSRMFKKYTGISPASAVSLLAQDKQQLHKLISSLWENRRA